jgi:hypothetical protein
LPLYLLPLLLSLACQSTVDVTSPDSGPSDGGSISDAGPANKPPDSGAGPIQQASDAGVCNYECTSGQLCASTGSCVSCLEDSNCAGSQVGLHCETRSGSPEFGTCVQCVQSAQCGSGTSCDPLEDDCVPTCTAATCAAQSQICDPGSGACVDCLHDSDCDGLYCDPVTLSCVECRQPSDCPASAPGCYEGSCGQCGVAADCPGSEACVNQSCSCAADSACPASTPVCIVDAGGPPMCGCAGNSSCPGKDQVCDPSRGPGGACVISCAEDAGVCLADTGTGQSFCDTQSGLCVECLTAAQCTQSDAPICLQGQCAECATDQDCAPDAGTPYCLVSQGGLCVQCTSAAQCPAANPGCDSSSWTCGSCTLSSDCPAGETCNADAGVCG